MTLIALGSIKGSPGVTTTMVGLAAVWPAGRHVFLVEADPDGGDLAARAGLRLEPGLSTLAAAGRHELSVRDLARHAQFLAGGIPVVVASSDPDQATRALNLARPRLAAALTGIDALIDVGRLRRASPAWPLVEAADLVLIVARPRLDALQHLVPHVGALLSSGVNAAVLLVGERPYPPVEVASALRVPVVGNVADDPDTAEVLCGSGGGISRLQRSFLLRSCRSLVDALPVAEGPASAGSSCAEGASGWARAMRREPAARLDTGARS